MGVNKSHVRQVEVCSGHLSRRATCAVRVFSASIFAASLRLTCGCTQPQGRTFGGGQAPVSGQISKEELREALDTFEEYVGATIKQVSRELDEAIPTARTRKTNLLWRAQVIPAYHTILGHENPIVGFMEAWGLSVRMTQYLETGEGSSLYGDHQQIAIDAAKQIETEIERIAKMFLKEGIFAEMSGHIRKAAGDHPIRGTYSKVLVSPTEIKEDEADPLMQVASLPMAPFRAMEGVDRGAEAINKFRGTAERFSDVVEYLPESSRWQLLLLLYDMEETEMVQTILASMSKISDSSSKLAESAERLPEQLREQLSTLVKEIDAKQANLQATLDQAEKTAVVVEHTLAKANEVSVSLERTAQSTVEAAQAWESAAGATTKAIKTWIDKPAKKGTSGSFKIDDICVAAESVTKAANELSSLTTEIRQLVESGHLTGHIEDVNGRVVGAVDRTALKAGSLTDHLSWRIAQLMLLFFGLALVYRFLAVRFDNLQKRKQQMVSADRKGSE